MRTTLEITYLEGEILRVREELQEASAPFEDLLHDLLQKKHKAEDALEGKKYKCAHCLTPIYWRPPHWRSIYGSHSTRCLESARQPPHGPHIFDYFKHPLTEKV